MRGGLPNACLRGHAYPPARPFPLPEENTGRYKHPTCCNTSCPATQRDARTAGSTNNGAHMPRHTSQQKTRTVFIAASMDRDALTHAHEYQHTHT
eukprot:11366145-Alexandrium_andersonii.AAC.1